MKKTTLVLLLIYSSAAFCQSINFISDPELFAPGIISTEVSEVKITFSPDGKYALWGTIGKENGVGGFDIWQCERAGNVWCNPKPVSFNSVDNDFDPCFSADGKTLYFFSNRPGGFGGDDIYYVQYDSVTNAFGSPVNMGDKFNTTGDEWGPTVSPDGNKFLFCTDGLNGKGKHDIYVCERTSDGWSSPKTIDEINSVEDDFDPVFLHDNKTILFTRKINEDETLLYISYLSNDGYSIPIQISNKINIPGTWNFGSSINPLDNSSIYYSTYIKDKSKGRLDIYRIKYSLTGTD